jgi:hypothetical protein
LPRCVNRCFHIVNRKRAPENAHRSIPGVRLYRAWLRKAKDGSSLDVVRVRHRQRNCLGTRPRQDHDCISHKEKARRSEEAPLGRAVHSGFFTSQDLALAQDIFLLTIWKQRIYVNSEVEGFGDKIPISRMPPFQNSSIPPFLNERSPVCPKNNKGFRDQ